MSNSFPPDQVKFYWRPGCPFCMRLEASLNRLEIPLEKHNIWEDAAAGAAVRAVAGGNETVPTVIVRDEALVNPSAEQVKALL